MCIPFFAPLGAALGASSAAAASTGTVAAASIGLGAASAGTSLYAQSQAASQQNAYRARLGIAQNKQYEQMTAAVQRDVNLQIDQLARREMEQATATRLELENISRNVRETAATTRARAGAMGAEGRVVDLLHNQFERDIAEFESVAARNIKTYRAQSEMEARAIYARGQNAINNGYPSPLPPIATVSPATSILNGITTGISVFGTLNSAFATPSGVGTGADMISPIASGNTYIPPQAPALLNPGATFSPTSPGYSFGGGFGFA